MAILFIGQLTDYAFTGVRSEMARRHHSIRNCKGLQILRCNGLTKLTDFTLIDAFMLRELKEVYFGRCNVSNRANSPRDNSQNFRFSSQLKEWQPSSRTAHLSSWWTWANAKTWTMSVSTSSPNLCHVWRPWSSTDARKLRKDASRFSTTTAPSCEWVEKAFTFPTASRLWENFLVSEHLLAEL